MPTPSLGDSATSPTAIVGAITGVVALVLSVINSIIQWRDRRPGIKVTVETGFEEMLPG